MECRARDWHDFLNVAWQTLNVRKAHTMVMKGETVCFDHTTYKTHIKNVCIFDHEKMDLKIAKFMSHSI